MSRLMSHSAQTRPAGRGSDGICQESESCGFFKQTNKGAYNREILSCGKQRTGSVRSSSEDEEESFQDKSAYASKVPGDDKKEDNHDPAWHTLTDYISFDKRTNTSKITSEKDKLAKKAVLQYRVISVTPDRDSSQNECIKTEFDIKLLTGRHHQIRLQLANIGYPLIGDTKYGKPVSNNSGTGSKSGRTGGGVREQLALCSYKIVFDHPGTGERVTFELP